MSISKVKNFNSREIAEIAFLYHMPLSYNGLVVENTNICNAKCKMCYQSSGPEGSEVFGKAKLDSQTILRCIKEAATIDTVKSRFHLAGGEAFLYLEESLLFFQEANKYNYENISTTTNAFWAKNRDNAIKICKQLRDSGLDSMEISWDYWHQEFISAEAINNALEACSIVGIDTTLRVLTNKNHNIQEALSMLNPKATKTLAQITSGPVFSTGRALKELNKNDFYESRAPLNDSCHKSLNLTINSFGNVFPCCAGFDQTQNYIVGNVKKESLKDIVTYMNNDPLIRKIVFSGIQSLVPILEKEGHKIGDQYNNICHLCWTIFSNKEYTSTIQDYMNKRKLESLKKYLHNLEESVK